MYEWFGIDVIAKGVKLGVVECVKHAALRLFGHVIDNGNNDFMKSV